MAWFRRNKTDDSVLPEVDKYYEGERRDRAGLAWLLAFVSVALVALLLVGLFLGGRWLYRTITDDNESEVAPTSNDNNAEDAPSFDGESSDQNGNDANGNNGEEGSSPEPTPAPSDDESAASGDVEQAPPQSTNTPPANPPSSSTPATGDNPDPLPATGPANMVGLFAGVSTIAGGIHYAVNTRKKK